MLSNDRFYKTRLHKGVVIRNVVTHRIAYDRCTYESATYLYDIDVRVWDGKRTYCEDGRPCPRGPIHKAIEKHYALNPLKS